MDIKCQVYMNLLRTVNLKFTLNLMESKLRTPWFQMCNPQNSKITVLEVYHSDSEGKHYVNFRKKYQQSGYQNSGEYFRDSL